MRILLLLSMFIASFSVHAIENYIGGGLNLDTYREDLAARYDLEDSPQLAPTLGYKAVFLWGNIGFRTGIFGEYKKVQVEDSAAPAGRQDIDLTAWYAAIPLNLQFNLNDNWAIFGGYLPRLAVMRTCDNCGDFDDDSNFIVNYFNAGVSWKFGGKWSMDVNFQHAQNDNFENLKISTAQALILYELE